MQVGIVGKGVTGNAWGTWLEENDNFVNYLDPRLSYFDSFDDVEAIFLCLPTPDHRGDQDISLLTHYCKQYSRSCYDVPIFVRSSILPGTTQYLNEVRKTAPVVAMPEFLTERSAQYDIEEQSLVVGSKNSEILALIKSAVPNSIISMTSMEAELAKYAHNCFGAMKVTYFNMIQEICDQFDMSYNNVLHGILNTNYINQTHTEVPGPDKKYGYGGKCFPDNVSSFTKWLYNHSIAGCDILADVDAANDYFRLKEKQNGVSTQTQARSTPA